LRFVRSTADEKATTTLGFLAECFKELGEIPKVVPADRHGASMINSLEPHGVHP